VVKNSSLLKPGLFTGTLTNLSLGNSPDQCVPPHCLAKFRRGDSPPRTLCVPKFDSLSFPQFSLFQCLPRRHPKVLRGNAFSSIPGLVPSLSSTHLFSIGAPFWYPPATFPEGFPVQTGFECILLPPDFLISPPSCSVCAHAQSEVFFFFSVCSRTFFVNLFWRPKHSVGVGFPMVSFLACFSRVCFLSAGNWPALLPVVS